MSPLTRLRLLIARLLIPAEMRATPEEAKLIRSLLDPSVLHSRNIEDGEQFHDQAAALQVQIDLETWGLAPGRALRSIGAAVTMPFDVHGMAARVFKVNITLESCEAAGLTRDPETIKWWEDQADAAKAAAVKDAVPLEQALINFSYWLTALLQEAEESGYSQEFGDRRTCPVEIRPSGNGAMIDVGMLEAAYSAASMTAPWAFWAIRDTRTMVDLGRFVGLHDRRVKRFGVLHEAAADAVYDGTRHTAVQRSMIALSRAGIALL